MDESPETQPGSICGGTEPLHKTQADMTLLLLQQQQVWKEGYLLATLSSC